MGGLEKLRTLNFICKYLGKNFNELIDDEYFLKIVNHCRKSVTIDCYGEKFIPIIKSISRQFKI